ncbi:MAG: alpha/beta hydrolase [Gammaproteobacteria bacterium]|nr:MAG: alpha/beta hydrolase [Gammaproteobacteria bacterium]TND05799.1 MAG: alpha/beta hydrolase [Gammaproteobacteria bacterium]
MANVLLTCRVVLLVCASLGMSGCTSMFFQPDKREVRNPAQLDLAYRDVYVKTPDGLTLHGWWLAGDAPAVGTVVFFHGNAENITTHIGSVYWLPKAHFNVLMMDYRGYGKSAGKTSLPGVLIDIDATLDYLLQESGLDSRNLIVFGQSLGGALAVYAVAHSPRKPRIRALVIDSAFSGYQAITREKMAGFWLTWPIQWLPALTMPAEYDPVNSIGRVSPVPVLIVQGEDDQIVPSYHAQRLFDAASRPKELWMVPGRGHIQVFNDTRQRERLVTFMRRAIEDPAVLPQSPGD